MWAPFELVLAGSIISLLLIGTVTYINSAFTYWRKRNVPLLWPPTFLLGHLPTPITIHLNPGVYGKTVYNVAKSKGHKHVGCYLFTLPVYFPIESDLIRNLTQRDFDHFTDRGFYHNKKDDPISENLFAIGGEQWKTLRRKLSPAFTSGKIKIMLDNVLQCGYQLQAAIENAWKKGSAAGIKEMVNCYTIDVIGSCMFGLECNSLKNPNSEFTKQGKNIFHFTPFRVFKTCFVFCWENVGRRLGLTLFDKESNRFFIDLVRNTKKYREVNNIVSKDMLQLLFDVNKDCRERGAIEAANDGLSTEEIAAQVFIFFAAGFETSSATLTFCLYEMALNPDIQSKVREEVTRVLAKHGDKVTYDAILDMSYMNQVVEETLRKYPPVSFITRRCTRRYNVPGTDTNLEEGTHVCISILGLHHDSDYYPEPDKFDPERFSNESKGRRIPCTYMPFGEGPRTCIGLRFGLMVIKTALTVLLKRYKFSLNSKTEVPLEIVGHSFTLRPKGGVFLDVDKLA